MSQDDCDKCEEMLQPYLDRELSAAATSPSVRTRSR